MHMPIGILSRKEGDLVTSVLVFDGSRAAPAGGGDFANQSIRVEFITEIGNAASAIVDCFDKVFMRVNINAICQ